MPLVEHYKYVRVLKAQRKRSPLWQREDIPTTEAGKETYAIAAKHEGLFSRAFLKAMRNLLPKEPPPDFKRAWKAGSTQLVMDLFPFFRAGAKDIPETWEELDEDLIHAYNVVVQEAGDFVTEEMNDDFHMDMRFSLVEKGRKREGPPPVAVIPINPYSKKWIKERALELIKVDITTQQRKVVRALIKDNFKRGIRAEVAYQDIKASIGLTEQWAQAVENRRELLLESDMSEDLVEKKVSIYREQLLHKRAQRIARTETITAQARGRQDAWRTADGAGLLPEVERKWLTAPAGCPICDSLDGKTADLGEPYTSSYGSFMGPGSDTHPHCRCSEKLQRKAS